ncbi:MAG: mechanosensitive ion channel family protein [Gracilimonas sp.]|nr:mechanosensitive ion channel family protein [Gracilimonas sp.]
MNDQVQAQLERLIELIPELIGATSALIIFFFIGRLSSKAIARLLESREHKGVKQTRLVVRLIRWAFNIFGVIIALNILGLTQVAASFLAAGGVVAVVLGFAFREIGENLLAGFFLSFSRSFDVGDLIESNGIRGTVKRIEIREVHIRTADGCDIYIPSATIYKNPLHNFTRDGLRRSDFTIGIDFGDDPQAARELLLKKINDHPHVLKKPEADVQISGFNPTYIELTVYLWVNTFNTTPLLGEVRSQLMKDCLQVLSENGYTFSSNVTTAIDMLPVEVRLDSQESKT